MIATHKTFGGLKKIYTQRIFSKLTSKKMQDYQNLLLQYTGEYEGTVIDDVASITDEKVRYDIVHQMISWASIERVDGFKMRTIISVR